jgi:uncharacterized membrane protein YdjX (TVP38/TMEM64 family)
VGRFCSIFQKFRLNFVLLSHNECMARAKGEEKEHTRVQDREELPVCPLCNNQCKPTDAVAYIGGLPRHSECIARSNAGAEKAPAKDYNAASMCSSCNKVIEGSQKNIVGGKEYHLACWAQKNQQAEKEHTRVQDRGELPVCPLCNVACKPTDAVAYIGGLPRHSECIARSNAGAEKAPAKDYNAASMCSSCNKVIEGSQKNIVGGKEYHLACWAQKNQQAEKEHTRVQDRGELPVCPLCNVACKPTDAVAYIGGLPRHSECIARSNAGAEKAPAKDYNAASMCSSCNKVIEGSQKNIVGGKEYHLACWAQKNQQAEKEHTRVQDRGELPVCPLCNVACKPTDAVAYIGGLPRHSECIARSNAGAEKAPAKDYNAASMCSSCNKVIEGSQKNIVGGKEYHLACWAQKNQQAEKEHTRVQDRGELPVCPLCNVACKPTDAVAYIGGLPRHSECIARANWGW